MTPFIKWVGGKRKLLTVMQPYYPEGFYRYCEPFLGGGAVFFGLAEQGKIKKALLGDVNQELILTYRAIRDSLDEVAHQLRGLWRLWGDETFYYQLRDVSYQSLPPTDAAARFIFLNKSGFNGLYRVNKKGQFNVPYGGERRVDLNALLATLQTASTALDAATIYETDFTNLMVKVGPGDFCYCDPPYAGKFTSYTAGGFTWDKQCALASAARDAAARGATIMISSPDIPEIRELYQGFYLHPVNVRYDVSGLSRGRGRVGELIITSYEPPVQKKNGRHIGGTIASRVSPETNISELNLDWTEADMPQSSRTKHVHGIHPYLGKFIPQLVEVFLRKYFRPEQKILDPFVGSGTSLVQANEMGLHAIGCDISAFNVMLSRAKTHPYDPGVANREAKDILVRTFEALEDNHPGILPIDSPYLNQWFAPHALHELMTYRHFIENGSYQYSDLLRLILTRSARSARLITHFDLEDPKATPQNEPYWCYKHKRTCYPVQEAFKFLLRYSLDTLGRITQFARVRTDAQIAVYHADSRILDIPEMGFDGIVTSPPYVGLIDYHAQHQYAYEILGLEDHRDREIGAAATGASKLAQAKYVADMTAVFLTATKKLKPGSIVIVVANDSHNLYLEIGRASGMVLLEQIQRMVSRRTGRRPHAFTETIFVWRTDE